ncbi:hypothetical protein HK102_007712, partial [Quaeritorhiza haematococci]
GQIELLKPVLERFLMSKGLVHDMVKYAGFDAVLFTVMRGDREFERLYDSTEVVEVGGNRQAGAKRRRVGGEGGEVREKRRRVAMGSGENGGEISVTGASTVPARQCTELAARQPARVKVQSTRVSCMVPFLNLLLGSDCQQRFETLRRMYEFARSNPVNEEDLDVDAHDTSNDEEVLETGKDGENENENGSNDGDLQFQDQAGPLPHDPGTEHHPTSRSSISTSTRTSLSRIMREQFAVAFAYSSCGPLLSRYRRGASIAGSSAAESSSSSVATANAASIHITQADLRRSTESVIKTLLNTVLFGGGDHGRDEENENCGVPGTSEWWNGRKHGTAARAIKFLASFSCSSFASGMALNVVRKDGGREDQVGKVGGGGIESIDDLLEEYSRLCEEEEEEEEERDEDDGGDETKERRGSSGATVTTVGRGRGRMHEKRGITWYRTCAEFGEVDGSNEGVVLGIVLLHPLSSFIAITGTITPIFLELGKRSSSISNTKHLHTYSMLKRSGESDVTSFGGNALWTVR